MKTWKNHPQKLLIIAPKFFFQYCQPAQIQPKSQFLFHKNCSSRDLCIMTLCVMPTRQVFLSLHCCVTSRTPPSSTASETYENLNVGICDFSKSWSRTYWFIFLPESKQNSKVDPTIICSMSSNTFCSSPLCSIQTLCPACLQ